MEKVRVKVEDMNCESCMKVITHQLELMNGVKEVAIDKEKKEVVITYDNPEFCVDDFTCKIEDLGYNKVQVVP